MTVTRAPEVPKSRPTWYADVATMRSAAMCACRCRSGRGLEHCRHAARRPNRAPGTRSMRLLVTMRNGWACASGGAGVGQRHDRRVNVLEPVAHAPATALHQQSCPSCAVHETCWCLLASRRCLQKHRQPSAPTDRHASGVASQVCTQQPALAAIVRLCHLGHGLGGQPIIGEAVGLGRLGRRTAVLPALHCCRRCLCLPDD